MAFVYADVNPFQDLEFVVDGKKCDRVSFGIQFDDEFSFAVRKKIPLIGIWFRGDGVRIESIRKCPLDGG